jgi:predicted pyridoxine 5'-phosphate oxidase superfamily flavin-nucleotide-binding protein
MSFTSDVAFSDAVKRVQRARGSRDAYARMERLRGGFEARLTPEIAAFIAERDSAYLATASAIGQPYVQHRGGPPGFIKVIDPRTLAFADFAGNRQYVTTGNLSENDRAFLFLMNYAEGERIKIWGTARVVEPDGELAAKLVDPHYPARVEQAIVFDVAAWDANCSQHIPRLIHAEAAEAEIAALRDRVQALETMLRDAGTDV